MKRGVYRGEVGVKFSLVNIGQKRKVSQLHRVKERNESSSLAKFFCVLCREKHKKGNRNNRWHLSY